MDGDQELREWLDSLTGPNPPPPRPPFSEESARRLAMAATDGSLTEAFEALDALDAGLLD